MELESRTDVVVRAFSKFFQSKIVELHTLRDESMVTIVSCDGFGASPVSPSIVTITVRFGRRRRVW